MTETVPLFSGVGGPVFIAEVSSNHHRDLDRCLHFIDTAHACGCGAVKFQLFRIRELFAPEILERSARHRARTEWELPPEFLPALTERTHALGMLFSCTPFYLDAVGELEPFVDFYKIASYELLWDDLLRACARTGKPVVLSTGMADMDEIGHACDTLRGSGCRDLTLLHCVSSYPTPPVEMNLSAIDTLRAAFAAPVGLSDHSVSSGVIHRAVHRFGAAAVEFHLDLDGEGEEYAAGHCWLPDRIGAVIDDIRTGIAADGDGVKSPSPSELSDRDWRADPSDGLRPIIRTRQTWNP
ncbi:MAG: N-acetylneuraminate synthase family protein [Alphaproteobacteria bacterium]|nr:N-acetylneuraminate synthase family protein [Alphaproteobacteria bacterium]MBF0249288.1 N-acetylneuraminate synthase family protein [Alphaproteobacteria bacterium]